MIPGSFTSASHHKVTNDNHDCLDILLLSHGEIRNRCEASTWAPYRYPGLNLANSSFRLSTSHSKITTSV